MSALCERLKRLGPVVRYYKKKYPSDSTCYRCGLPWSLLEFHAIAVRNREEGFFTCCEYCWQRMTDLEKIDSVVDLFFKWELGHGSPYTNEEMLDALARDLQGEANKEE